MMTAQEALARIRTAIGTSGGFTVLQSTAGDLVQPVLDAAESGNQQQLQASVERFLLATEATANPNAENAYENLLTWRETPPQEGSIFWPVKSLTASQNERLAEAIQKREYDRAEEILGTDVFTKLRVLVTYLQS